MDCADGTRNRGGTPSSNRGEGDVGLCGDRATSSAYVSVGIYTVGTERTLDPKCEICQRFQLMRPLVVLNKLKLSLVTRSEEEANTHTAAGTPAAGTALPVLWWCPFPRPLKLNRRTSTSRVVPYKLDLGVLVQIGVGVKFASDQIVQLPRACCKDKGQAVDYSVHQACRGDGRIAVDVVYAWYGKMLSKYECEVEGKLLVVGQA
jgi:hypothetical protein